MYFSVIVTVYRVERYLRQCIDSILEQSFGDFELILVNDGSPDRCPVICEEYAAGDHRVRLLHRPNGGPTAARKTGLRAAKGEYVVNVDGDDWLARDALEYLHDRAEEYGADVVIPAKCCEYPDSDRVRMERESLAEGFYCGDTVEKQLEPLILMDQNMNHLGYQQSGVAIRRTLLLPCQMSVDDEVKFGEDLLCMMAVYQSMGCVYISHRAVYHVQRRADSISSGIGDPIFDNFLYLLKVLRGMEAEKGGDFSQRVDRYTSFTCFLLMEQTVSEKAYRELARIKRRMADPLIREGILHARFGRLKPKRKITLFLMRRKMLRTAYGFLRGYESAKALVHALGIKSR